MVCKGLFAASFCCVVASMVIAAPTLNITGNRNYLVPNPVRVWNVAVSPDFSVATSAGVALELGFQATGGNILSISAAPNMAAAAAPAPARVLHDNYSGNPIFGWETLTDVDPGDDVNLQAVGIQLGTGTNANEAVAYIGTNTFTNPASFPTTRLEDLITITTDSSVTSLSWGGRYNADGSLAALTGSLPGLGRINQGDGTPIGGTNYQDESYAGSLSSTSTFFLTHRFVGDTSGDGRVNNFDVAPFNLALSTPNQYKLGYAPHLNILRSDVNGDGRVNNFDVVPFVTNISNPFGGAGAAIPEPDCIMLTGIALAGLAIFTFRAARWFPLISSF